MEFKRFYEMEGIKPLIQNAIVDVDGRQFRVDRWFSIDGHCYEFMDLTIGEAYPPFFKSPSYVKESIESGKLKVIKNG